MKNSSMIEKINGFDVHVGLEGNYISVSYLKQCSLAWSCVEESGWSCLVNCIGP